MSCRPFLFVLAFLLPAVLALALPSRAMALGPEYTVDTDDGYDWIQLTSREWLKGELVSLYEDELTFDSDHFGVLKLDLEDVARLRSARVLSVRLLGDETRTGQVQIDGQSFSVDGAVSAFSGGLAQLLAVTPEAKTLRDLWDAELGFGSTIRSGNADTAETNVMASIERRGSRNRFQADYIGNFQETDGEEIANNHRINTSMYQFTGQQLFWRPFRGQFFRDPFQNIEQQWTLETGIGYEVMDTSRTEWLLGAGLGANYVRYQSVEVGEDRDSTSPALTLSSDFETELTNWMDYLLQLQVTFLDEDGGEYQHHFVTGLSTDLIGDLDLDVSFVWDRIQRPQQREDGTTPEQDDFRFLISVGYEF